MQIALLDGNNVVIAVPSLENFMTHQRLTSNHVLCLITPVVGMIFNDQTSAFEPAPRKRWITKLAFDSRFTMNEATHLKLAQVLPTRLDGETDQAYLARCVVPAQLQVMQSRLNMATYIDLDRADTREGVQSLEQLGLLAAGRANEILDGPLTEAEYYKDA